jgi:hypothetical protein
VEPSLPDSVVIGAIGAVDARDRRVVFTDRMSDEVILAAPGAATFQRAGGSGRGPGEYRSPGGVTYGVDGITVFDPALLRFTRYDQSLNLREVDAIADIGFANPPQVVGWLETSGAVVVRNRRFQPGRGMMEAQMSRIFSFTSGSDAGPPLFEAEDGLLGQLDGAGIVSGPIGQARLRLAVVGDRIIAIRDSRSVIEVRDDEGTLVEEWRLPAEPILVVGAVADKLRALHIARWGADSQTAQNPLADTLPAFDEMVGVGEDEVWLRRFTLADLEGDQDGRHWWQICVDRLGASRSIRLSSSFEPKSRDAGSVFGISTDAVGVETLASVQVAGCRE